VAAAGPGGLGLTVPAPHAKAAIVPDTYSETPPVDSEPQQPAADAGNALAARRRFPRWLTRTTVSAVLAVVVIAAAVVFAVFLSKASSRDSVTSQRESALASARQAAVNFTSYDYRHLDADYKRVRDGATGAFKADFDKQSKVLAQVIQQSKAVATGQVVDAAIVSAGSSDATVLVAVDDTITNTQAPKGVVKHYRLRIDLKKIGGQWLVANVQPVA
jgi:Mce-associated membrane protein